MPVYKQGVEDSIKSSLLTAIGDIIAASAVSTPARIAAPASGQVLTGQGAGVLPAWAAATGAVARAGSNTVAATTTSTTLVNLLAVSSLSISGATPIIGYAVVNRATGGVTDFRCIVGLMLNSTLITNDSSWSDNATGATAGGLFFWVPARITNYDTGGNLTSTNPVQGIITREVTIATPTATITDVVIRARVGDASVTMGADEMHVYTYAVS